MSGLVRSYCKVDDCSVLYGNELDRIAEGACNITGVVLYAIFNLLLLSCCLLCCFRFLLSATPQRSLFAVLYLGYNNVGLGQRDKKGREYFY